MRSRDSLRTTVLKLSAIGSFVLMASNAFAYVQISPEWSKSATCDQPNESYLYGSTRGLVETSVADEYLKPGLSPALKQKFDLLQKEIELKERHDLLSHEDRRAYNDRRSGLMREAINDVRRYNVQTNLNKLRKVAERNEDLAKARRPLEVAALAAGIYYGEPIRFNLNSETKVMARTEVPKRKGELKFTSPLLSGGVDYAGSVDPNDLYAAQLRAIEKEERYRFSLSRGLPIWDLSSGLTYGGSTTQVTASLSKKLSENLTCVVDSSQPLQPGRSDMPNGQESVKVQYDIRF